MMVRQAHHIGLIAGAGKLPLILARCARDKGERVTGIAIKGLTSPELERHVDKIYWGEVTEAKRALEILRSEKINLLVMTGKIPKAVIFNRGFERDKYASEIFRRTIDSRDYTIFKAVAARLKKEGIRFMDPRPYFCALLPKKGLLAGRDPSKEEWKDINFGRRIAKKIAAMDIGQTVVVKKRLVVAVEGMESTDEAIKRAGRLGGENTVVVKVARSEQDMRFDIPTVGLETIDSMIEARASLLAVEAGRMLVVDKNEVAKKADSAGIAVVAI